MFTKTLKTMAFVLVITLLLVGTNAEANLSNSQERISLEVALDAYSVAMSTDTHQKNVYLSNQIQELVLERKAFYERFLEEGAHSNLVSISAEFVSSQIEQLSADTYSVVEMVTITGRPILQVAKDYPPYKAYVLAARMTKEPILSNYLLTQAEAVLASVQESIDAGTFEFVEVLTHTLTFDPKTGRITADTFSSESNDDSGRDKVVWVDGKPQRVEPDLTQMPDYVMYQKSIEEQALEILEDVKNVPLERLKSSNTLQYSGASAATYARTWVRITPLAPCAGGVLQDRSSWNPSYTGYSCADCANYVSQALRYGGMSTDST